MQNLLTGFKALADENRLKIIMFLLRYDFCVGALARNLGISRAAVSQQLQVLRKAGLVKGEKRGYWTHYSVEREALEELAEGLLELGKKQESLRLGCQRQQAQVLSLEEAGFHVSNKEGREENMCQCSCQKPQKLESEPGKCSPEKIKECHGDEENHPCVQEQEE